MMFKSITPCALTLSIAIALSCKNQEPKTEPTLTDTSSHAAVTDSVVAKEPENVKPAFTYSWIKKKDWQAMKDSFEGAQHLDILKALNRVDLTHLKRLDSIIIPNDYSRPLVDYMPFPDHLDVIKDVKKIILFSYPTQTFAAYENGKLVRTGPTNMGKKATPTPRGLFFTNWKAKKTVSTVDDEWILKWNFNVSNKGGVGFHEYALPGYPASHSCMRLLSEDAQFLYSWADQWILKNDRELAASGTPVIVFGNYPFGEPRPWFKVIQDAAAMTIPVDSLNNIVKPHISTIIEKQTQRQQVEAAKASGG